MRKDPHKKREARKYQNPIASREFILETMAELDEPTGKDRLLEVLKITEEADQEALGHRLRAMVRDGQLVADRRNIYAIASRMEVVTGKVLAHADGFGFLSSEHRDDDVFLSSRQMRAVFHGDIAQVRIRGRDRRGRSEGEIVEVVERNTQQIVARLYYEGELNLLESLNTRIGHEIIAKNLDRKKCKPGQIVVADIIEQPSLHGMPTAEVLEVLGDHLTPDMEVEVALRNQDIPFVFSDDVNALVDKMPIEVAAKDKKNRKDLRSLPFVTIDGEDARDFDDAVYCRSEPQGGFCLMVAIADVAHYVEAGSVLDDSALQRGTSVYFPQYVVPMLPEKLSNGLCSLKPEVDRLVLVCEMQISATGDIENYQFYEAVIHSHARLTYTMVAGMLSGEAPHPELQTHIDDLDSLYRVLQSQRHERGALEFESTELAFDFDAEGRVRNISQTVRNDAHRLIEECMLCANVCAARFIEHYQNPGLYRVHEPPTEEKAEGLKDYLKHLGIKANWKGEATAKNYQSILRDLQQRENGRVLQVAVLRSLNQAVYQVQNRGHFGLNFDHYAHFTSPIRRYPDLMMHRLIKSIIHSHTNDQHVQRFGKPARKKWYPYKLEDVIAIGERSSFTERRAESAVYEVLEWIKCDYISDQVGDIASGTITGVTKFGLFVELTDIFIEGLIHISTLVGDYYHFDATSQSLIGGRTGETFALGETVEVQITRVDVDDRKVDFELVSHANRRKSAGAGKKKAGSKSKRKSKADSKTSVKASSKAKPGAKPKSKRKPKPKSKPKPNKSSKNRRKK